MHGARQQWMDWEFEQGTQVAAHACSARLGERYDAAAATWHGKLCRLGYLSVYRRLLAGLVREGSLPSRGKVLDCGIGSGAFCAALLDVTGDNWAIDGVDLSAQMLIEARNRLSGRADRLTLHRCDAARLPLAASSMDLVISAHMVEHAAEPLLLLREMVRVLRPGAPVVLLVTRPGAVGSYLARRWPITCWNEVKTVELMTAVGVCNVRRVPLPLSLCRWSSTAWIGYKPGRFA